MMKTIKFLWLGVLFILSQNALGNYRTFVHQDVEFGVFEADAKNVSLHWKDANDKPYVSLSRLKNALEVNYQIQMLMNAGIYSKALQPAGLWIENGKLLHSLNTQKGTGNFHVQPNGVFFIQSGTAKILTTQAYQQGKYSPQWALQSGPMLIINGRENHQFRASLASFHKRNAVCLTKTNQLYFVMTIKGEPNLFYFTQGLQKLGCYNALYLDGTISNWYIPQRFSSFHWNDFVGFIAVTEKK